MCLEIANNWRSVLQTNILKKMLDFEPNHLSLQEVYFNILYLSDWCLYGLYVWQKSRRKNIWNSVITWITFKTFDWFKCFTALWLLRDLSWKATRLKKLTGHFRPRLSPDTENRAFAKNGNCLKILDTTLTEECYL